MIILKTSKKINKEKQYGVQVNLLECKWTKFTPEKNIVYWLKKQICNIKRTGTKNDI